MFMFLFLIKGSSMQMAFDFEYNVNFPRVVLLGKQKVKILTLKII